MRIWPLALVTAGLPALGIGLALYFSMAEGHIAACQPWLDGCTTVSRTGRHGTGFFVFKALVLPAAGVLGVFWTLAAYWLRRRLQALRSALTVAILGTLGAAMLALYTSYLGSEGVLFALYRRIGASSFLASNFFCQLIFASALQPGQLPAHPANSMRLLRLIAIAQLLIGLASLPITTWAGPEQKTFWENVLEWWFSAIQLTFFLAIAWLWWNERVDFPPTRPPD